jgi:hypothetical protein
LLVFVCRGLHSQLPKQLLAHPFHTPSRKRRPLRFPPFFQPAIPPPPKRLRHAWQIPRVPHNSLLLPLSAKDLARLPKQSRQLQTDSRNKMTIACQHPNTECTRANCRNSRHSQHPVELFALCRVRHDDSEKSSHRTTASTREPRQGGPVGVLSVDSVV